MSSDDQGGSETPDPARWRILAVLMVTVFMTLVGVSIVNVALPSIQTGLGASQSEIQWVLSGYALTFGIVLVAAGRAGDILGRGPLFLAGVTVFTLASVAAGLAADPAALNIARFVQGLGSGLLNPQAVGMIQQYFRGAERGRAFGLFGSVVGVSVAVGPVLGGVLIAVGGVEDGWRWTFLINVPVGLTAIVLAWRWFPRPMLVKQDGPKQQVPEQDGPKQEAAKPDARIEHGRRAPGRMGRGAAKPRDLDPVGALLLGAAVLTILLPFVESRGVWWIWALLPVGAGLVLLWLRWERRYKERGRTPMVDLAIFRTGSFSQGTLLVSLYFFGATSIWVLVALYMQQGLGHTALESGLVGLPSALLAAVSANWAGKRVLRYGRKLVIAGMFSALGGLLLSIGVIQLQAAGVASEWWLLLSLAFIGLGQGSVISPNQTLTLAEVPLSYAGSSGAIVQTGQRIGTSIGIAVITAAAFAVLAVADWVAAMSVGFSAIIAVVLVALLVAFRDLRRRQQYGEVRA